MNYSPKLKKVMEEIKSILKENDVAGMIVLHTPGFGEHHFHLNTSYSAVSLINGGMRIKTTDLPISKKAKSEMLRDSANMLHILSELGGIQAMNIMEVSMALDKKLESDHFGSGYSSHNSQNN